MTINRVRAALTITLLSLSLLAAAGIVGRAGAQGVGTPEPSVPCAMLGTPAAVPATPVPGDAAAMEHAAMGHETGTPAAVVEFDQTYIDMMLPHHASVIALAQAALPRLTDDGLQSIARAIVDGQSGEQAMLAQFRQQWYGSAEPAPMDTVMAAMATVMPAAHDLMMADMDLMDAGALVARFCAAPAADLAFIDLVIPHHESAIAASEPALTAAVHPEIRAFAAGVIATQQAEIDQLTAIRASLTGTPVASPAA